MKIKKTTESNQSSILILTSPTQKKKQETTYQLNRCFTKQQLQTMMGCFKKWLMSHDVMKMDRQGNYSPCNELTGLTVSSAPKDDISQAMAFLLAEPENLKLYVSYLSEGMREVWRTLLYNVFISERKAQKLLNREDRLVSKSDYYYYSEPEILIREMSLLAVRRFPSADLMTKWGYRERENFFTANRFIHRCFFPAFFPHAYEDDISMGQLYDENLTLIEMEQESVSKAKLMESMLMTGEVEIKPKGITSAQVKKAAKKLGLQEFYPDSPNTYLAQLRTQFYVSMQAISYQVIEGLYNTKREKYEDKLAVLFSNIGLYDLFLFPMMFPHIKGVRKNQQESNCCEDLLEFMLRWLCRDSEMWVPLEDLYLKCFVTLDNESTLLPYSLLVINPDEQKDNVDIVNSYSNKNLSAENYAHEFGYTFLQSSAFMLCSLGMAELALSQHFTRYDTPFEQVKYLRLTPLGRYVLGVTDTYEPPRVEHEAYFELDSNRLIVRSLVEPNPYAQLLKDTASPISRNRYEMSPSSFLANCHNKQDVERKIDTFRNFISSDLPPLWEKFFQQLLDHCNPLCPAEWGFRHYVVSPHNEELIRLLTTDEKLRHLIIRAENYLILVKLENVRQFEEQLKRHGYLL